MLHSAALAPLTGIGHGFFTRQGGTSEGLYASLNCGPGSDDAPDRVAENRRRVLTALGLSGGTLLTLYQVHGAETRIVTEPWPDGNRPQADSMVTDRPGLALGILTADCAPVLLADPHAGIIGAAHAGWKGALHGVIGSTISTMEQLGARREHMTGSVGPCISRASYEVSTEFRTPFYDQNPANDQYFAAGVRNGHLQFDLQGYVRQCLHDAGVGTVDVLNEDTRDQEDVFFSYRRACLRGEADYGRQVSAICLYP
jgi:YfiH family protein